MTKDEFEKRYAENTHISVEELRELGGVIKPCVCDYKSCPGWQMIFLKGTKMKNTNKIRQLLKPILEILYKPILRRFAYGGDSCEIMTEDSNLIVGHIQEALALLDEPFTIENAEVPEGFLLIKADSFLARLNKIAPCETCNGTGKKPQPCKTCHGTKMKRLPGSYQGGSVYETCPDCQSCPDCQPPDDGCMDIETLRKMDAGCGDNLSHGQS